MCCWRITGNVEWCCIFQNKEHSNLSFELSILSCEANKEAFEEKLCEWCGTKNFELLYRGSCDGLGASDFHRLCDNKGKTLVLSRTQVGMCLEALLQFLGKALEHRTWPTKSPLKVPEIALPWAVCLTRLSPVAGLHIHNGLLCQMALHLFLSCCCIFEATLKVVLLLWGILEFKNLSSFQRKSVTTWDVSCGLCYIISGHTD